MTDRIANPWGGRTPFGQGEDWPIRVDQFLEEGVTEEEVDRWVQTASILHSNGDGLDIAVKDERIVGVRGRAEDRVNKGRVDPKDLFGWLPNLGFREILLGSSVNRGDPPPRGIGAQSSA